MIDWREHIQNDPTNPSVRGTEVEVTSVLRLLRDGWSIERVLTRFPALTTDDVRACLDYAEELVERGKLRDEMLRRMRDSEEHPELQVPHEEAMRLLQDDEAEDPRSETDE